MSSHGVVPKRVVVKAATSYLTFLSSPTIVREDKTEKADLNRPIDRFNKTVHFRYINTYLFTSYHTIRPLQVMHCQLLC